jgi:L-rhamnose isomerase
MEARMSYKCVVCKEKVEKKGDSLCAMCSDSFCDHFGHLQPFKYKEFEWAAHRAREKAIEKASKWLAQACINYEPVSRRADIVWFFEKHMSE